MYTLIDWNNIKVHFKISETYQGQQGSIPPR